MYDQLLIPSTSVKETLSIWTDTTLRAGVSLLHRAVDDRQIPTDETWRVNGSCYWTWFAFRGNYEAACRLGLAAIGECVKRGLPDFRTARRLFEQNKGGGKFAPLPFIFHTEVYQEQVKKVLFQYGQVEAHICGFLNNRRLTGSYHVHERRVRDSWLEHCVMDPFQDPRERTLTRWQCAVGYDVGTNPYEEFGPVGLNKLRIEIPYDPWNEMRTNAVAVPAEGGGGSCSCNSCQQRRNRERSSVFSVD